MATPTIDVVIHDDLSADVLTPQGRVVRKLTVTTDGDLGAAVGDYVAEQARLFETPVLVRTSRGDGAAGSLLLVDGDRQATEMVLTDDGTVVPATELREDGFLTETTEPVVDDVETLLEDVVVDEASHNDAIHDEVTQTADFTVNDPAPTEPIPTQPIAPEPIAPPPAPQASPRPRPATTPTGPVQVPTGGAAEVPGGGHGFDAPQARPEPTQAPRPPRPKPAGKRSAGPHVPRPPRSAPAPAEHDAGRAGRLGQVWANHRRPILVIAGAVLALAVAAGLLAGGLFSSGDSTAPTDPVEAMATPDPTSDAVECPTRTEGATTTGRDPGNQTSGANVIKAFDYAYYTWRSGTAARAMVSSDGKVAPAIQIQSAIDVLDQDLRYCLSITDRGRGVYGVELTEIPPIGEPRVINQKITTTEIGGKFWIAAIEKDTPKP
ncbi:hypothetical protein [Gordonia terrae]|uniref:hypothetical protein n=1 Tax=Gordonia terrae TaxID=2055 RepID=UPI003F6D6526